MEQLNLPVQKKWFWFLITAIAGFKLWVSGFLTLAAVFLEYDDLYYIQQAEQLIRGNWLGNYTNLVLVKGPFYPIWIALGYWLGVPLLLSQQLLLIGAGLWFMVALRPLCKNPWLLLLIFAWMIFIPIGFGGYCMGQVTRAGIYPWLLVMVLSGAMGMMLRWQSSMKNLLVWGIGLGLALAAFWMTREESIVVVPALGVLFAFPIYWIWKNAGQQGWKRIALFLVPFVVWFSGMGVVAFQNYSKYQKFCIVELQTPEFKAAYGALLRVKHDRFYRNVPVPKATRMKIYPFSPVFSEIQPYLEGEVGKRWQSFSGGEEIKGGAFFWALRDAVAKAGYHANARKAAEYYRRLAQEVNAACDAGKLAASGRHNSMTPIWHKEYWPLLIDTVTGGVRIVLTFEGFNPQTRYSGEAEWMDLQKYFADISSERMSPLNQWEVKGWMFHPQAAIQVFLLNEQGKILREVILKKDPGLYEYFKKNGEDYPGAKLGGPFHELVPGPRCRFGIKQGDQWLMEIPLDGSVMWMGNRNIRFGLGKAEQPGVLKYQTKMAERKMKWAKGIGQIYQQATTGLLILACLVFLAGAVALLWKKTQYMMVVIIGFALSLGIAGMFGALAYVNISSFTTLIAGYLAPVYPMVLMFIAVSWAGIFLFSQTGLNQLKKNMQAKKNNDGETNNEK